MSLEDKVINPAKLGGIILAHDYNALPISALIQWLEDKFESDAQPAAVLDELEMKLHEMEEKP